jgi:CO dehydrogenase maturation factor
MDMEAGVEHLGRATAGAMDAVLVVVEPGRRSLQTALSINELARGLGIDHVFAVGNKVRAPADEGFIAEQLPDWVVLGYLPEDASAVESDRRGVAVFDLATELLERARLIADRLTAIASAQ